MVHGLILKILLADVANDDSMLVSGYLEFDFEHYF